MVSDNKTPLEELIEQQQFITGLRAIRLAGIQDALVEELDIQNQYFGTMTTLRVADANNLPPFNSPASPKPSSIHSKTSPLVGGYIPVDPIFTRLDANRRPIGHHVSDNIEDQEIIQVKWTLYEIMQRCDNNGDLNIDWSNIPIVKMTFKPGKGPLDFNGEFILNLGEEKSIVTDIKDKRIFTRSYEDPTKHPYLIADIIAEQFDIEETIYYVYPIYYKINKLNCSESFKPLMVLAKNNMPIISDWDKDSESMPLDDIFLANKESNKEFNTFDSVEQRKLLLAATKNLFEKLCEHKKPSQHLVITNFFSNKYNFLQLINGNLLASVGVITPYELLRNMLANYFHNESHERYDYYKDPFQHGPNNRSPIGDPSVNPGSDGARLHIYQGKVIYTVNEEQRIKLYLVTGFLETNFIHIAPSADMEYWSIILERQVDLGQWELISPVTMEAYFKYQETELKLGKSLPVYNMDKWHLVVRSQLNFSKESLVKFLPIFKEYLKYCKKLNIEHLFTPIVVSSDTPRSSLDNPVISLTPEHMRRISTVSSSIDKNLDSMQITPNSTKAYQSLPVYTKYSASGKERTSLSSVDSEPYNSDSTAAVSGCSRRSGLGIFMTELATDLIDSTITSQPEQTDYKDYHLNEHEPGYYLSDRRKSKAVPKD